MIKSKKEKFSNVFFRILFDSSIFRIVFLIDLFFFSVAFCDLISRIINAFLMVWGGIILIHNYLINRNFKKIRYHKILLIFMSSCIATVILHAKDNLLLNLLYLFVYFLCFFVFYGVYSEQNLEKTKKEMFLLFKILIFLTTVVSFIGLVVTLTEIQLRVFDYYWLGIYENRLIGVYTNSNLLALFCVISIMFSHIIMTSDSFKNSKNKKNLKIIYITEVLINSISLFLSDSNGAFLFLLVYSVVYLFYYLFNICDEITIKIIIKNSIIILTIGTCLTVGSFEIRGICQDKMAVLINDMHQLVEPVHDNKISVDKNVDQIELDDEKLKKKIVYKENKQDAGNSLMDTVEIGRTLGEDDYDGSSGRVTLIKQAIVMFKKNPVMGIGIANIPDYGEIYIKGGLKFPNFHNGYITILVSWGIVGFIVFALFSLFVAGKFCKNLFKINDSQNTPFPNLFAIIVGYCIYSLVEITLLSDITFTIFIFWSLLGYAMSYMLNYERSFN